MEGIPQVSKNNIREKAQVDYRSKGAGKGIHRYGKAQPRERNREKKEREKEITGGTATIIFLKFAPSKQRKSLKIKTKRNE